jgi:hypothetical protein
MAESVNVREWHCFLLGNREMASGIVKHDDPLLFPANTCWSISTRVFDYYYSVALETLNANPNRSLRNSGPALNVSSKSQ